MIYVFLGSLYVHLTIGAILNAENNLYVRQITPDDLSTISYAKGLCTGISIAITLLIGQHTYFILTS